MAIGKRSQEPSVKMLETGKNVWRDKGSILWGGGGGGGAGSPLHSYYIHLLAC